jgi:hypothetical protein
MRAGMVNAATVRVKMTFETQLFSPFSMGEQYLKFLARLQVDSLTLASRRAHALMELPKTLSSCTSPDKLLTEQVLYWQLAQRQYAEACTSAFTKAAALAVMPDAEAGAEIENLETAKVEPETGRAPQRQRDVLTVAEARQESVAAAKPQVADPLPPVRVRLRRSA